MQPHDEPTAVLEPTSATAEHAPAVEENSTLGLLRSVARVGAQRVGEVCRPLQRPTSLDVVPISPEALTPEWLTAALCAGHPGARVLTVHVDGGSDGTSARRRVHVTYNDEGRAAGLPTAMFAKAAESFTSRLLLSITKIVEGESIFFDHVRDQLDGLRSPRAHYAANDPRTFRSIVLMEDLVAAGWSFPDPMELRVSHDDAVAMVEQMAIFHAAFWDSPQLTNGPLSRLRDVERFQIDLNERAGFRKRTEVGIERSESVMPARLFARREQIWPAYMRSLGLNVRGAQTLLHQDVHAGNWLRDPEGRMGLYDWQCVATGGWAADVSYALGNVLDTGDRRAWERDLLDHYLDRLAAEGVRTPPSSEHAWEAYAQQPLHGLVYGLFTIGRGRLQPMMQPVDYCLRSIGRLAAAVDDLETLDRLARTVSR